MIRRIALVSTLALATAGSVSAQYDDDRRGSNGPLWDTARVLDVDPILAPGRPSFRQQCWQEPVRYLSYEPAAGFERRYTRPGGVGPNTQAVLGGIVGAAVGHQIGDGDGQRAATVAGALLGSAIARDSYRNPAQGRFHERRGMQREIVRYEERCRMVEDFRGEDRVVGYHVTYEYHGHTFTTRTRTHPGNSIRVRVEVTPEIEAFR